MLGRGLHGEAPPRVAAPDDDDYREPVTRARARTAPAARARTFWLHM